MIRKCLREDAGQVMKIWLDSNMEAHKFIPGEYWLSNYSMVQEQLLQAEIYIYEADRGIRGFIGIVDGYIAGVFVDRKYRSLGIGRQLLEYAKKRYSTLSLNVYKQNKRAVDFYLRERFSILSEDIEETTGEVEYTMTWEKKVQDEEGVQERMYVIETR